MTRTSFLRLVQLINIFSLPIGIIWLVIDFSYLYLFLMMVFVLLISKIGNSIGTHRYFCHRSFKTDPIREWILMFLSTLSTTAPIIQYSAVHRYHHAFSDTPEDIHSPKHLGFLRSFLHYYDKNFDVKKKLGGSWVKDLIKKKCCIINYNHYWKIIFCYVVLLALIDPKLILFLYCIPAGHAWLVGGILSSPLHLKIVDTYKNYESQDDSQNSQILNIITLGDGLHNNHHAFPSKYRLNFNQEKNEWDLPGWMIEKFFLIKAD
jgi:stearoyl-CoA desaturase (delta-9 desaturase)